MTKAEAIQAFWESFGLPAYEEHAVPTGALKPDFPYITYEYRSDSCCAVLPLTASLWYRTPSWSEIDAKAEEISKAIGYGGVTAPCTGGCLWIQRGTPFMQTGAGEYNGTLESRRDDMIKRAVLNIAVMFITQA